MYVICELEVSIAVPDMVTLSYSAVEITQSPVIVVVQEDIVRFQAHHKPHIDFL
jgi:hypothetical protein